MLKNFSEMGSWPTFIKLPYILLAICVLNNDKFDKQFRRGRGFI